MMELKLYSPLSAALSGEKSPETLAGADLLPYKDAIQTAMESAPLPEEQGLMDWFSGMPSVGQKVSAIHPTVEELDGSLWCVAVCKTTELLTSGEIYELKSFCEGQYCNAWGDVVRMKKQDVPAGKLEVHLWQSGNFRIKTAREMGLVKPPADRTSITHIDKDGFWALIDQARQLCGHDTELASDWLCAQLERMAPEEIIRFDAYFYSYKSEALQYGLWSAACVMRDGCSDDGFMDFRAWLVAQGKEVYLNALKDPDSLADLEVQGDCICESMGYIAHHAYEKRTGGGDLYRIKLPADLKLEVDVVMGEVVCGSKTRIPMEWAEMPGHLPKLCAKYHTPEDIQFRSRFPMWNYDSPAVQDAFRAVGKRLPKEKHTPKRGGNAR